MPRKATETTSAPDEGSAITDAAADEATMKAESTAKAAESKYTAAEFAANAQQLFNCLPDCVTAAFRVARVTEATKQDAEAIVKNFMNKEVK